MSTDYRIACEDCKEFFWPVVEHDLSRKQITFLIATAPLFIKLYDIQNEFNDFPLSVEIEISFEYMQIKREYLSFIKKHGLHRLKCLSENEDV